MNFQASLVMVAVVAAMAVPTAGQQTTSFASDAVKIAAQRPEIAAAIAAGERAENALLAHNVDGYAAAHAPELMINAPVNHVISAAQMAGAVKAGVMNDAAIERVIEYAAVRPTGEVLLMGAEHLSPQGTARNAGKAVTYRITEIWRRDGADWKLSVRQATIVEVN